MYDNSRFVTGHKSHTYYSCFWLWFETGPFVVVCVVGLVFLFFVAPFSLLAVFNGASAFNSDVSNWNTGAVTNMASSKCTPSPSLCGTPSVVVYFDYTTTRVSSDHNSHTFCYFFFMFLKTVPFCCLWWVGLSFSLLHPSLLAVFEYASAFNQDVSNWNTGAVTNMGDSKCTLSPSVCGHAFRCCVI